MGNAARLVKLPKMMQKTKINKSGPDPGLSRAIETGSIAAKSEK
jgi:hypothetical protein